MPPFPTREQEDAAMYFDDVPAKRSVPKMKAPKKVAPKKAVAKKAAPETEAPKKGGFNFSFGKLGKN